MFYYYRDEEGYLVSRRPLSPLDYRLTAVSEQEIAQSSCAISVGVLVRVKAAIASIIRLIWQTGLKGCGV